MIINLLWLFVEFLSLLEFKFKFLNNFVKFFLEFVLSVFCLIVFNVLLRLFKINEFCLFYLEIVWKSWLGVSEKLILVIEFLVIFVI